jgi:hypothetical protein
MTTRRDFETEIDAEIALAESSAPQETSTLDDAGWRANPEETLAYEARLTSLRGAYEVLESPLDS